MSDIPRCEYPRPQFRRTDWLCLNGEWQFEIDQGDSGLERGLCDSDLAATILVPFCPESELSGICHVDFMEAVWYRRTVTVPKEWRGRDLLLHFGAVDYEATVWVNGKEVGRHRGCWTPFECNLGAVDHLGDSMTIVVRARDPKNEPRPAGKQSNHRFGNAGCHYTRTTGIWQTVWLEPVSPTRFRRPRITPDLCRGAFRVEFPLVRPRKGLTLKASLANGAGIICEAQIETGQDLSPCLELAIPELRRRLWSPADPFLYDLVFELIDCSGEIIDRVESYAGLRSVAIDGRRVLLNGRPVCQRQVLDQGYYPDGILTAPTDDALSRDIELAKAVGFNSARLHQKVFEERFLYHADRLGYLVWGEFGDWGFRNTRWAADQPRHTTIHNASTAIIGQWLEALERDYSHPCIIGWCPLNETAAEIDDRMKTLDDMTRALFLATKAMDLSRPVLDVSGYSHRIPEADVYDCHDYDQDPESFKARHGGLAKGRPFENGRDDGRGKKWSIGYGGQPFFVSEFGGIRWNPDAQRAGDKTGSWGYGKDPEDRDAFFARLKGLCDVLLANPDMFGFCYTQLTDVFQEQNGVLTFDRREKFDRDRMRAILTAPAACEAATS